MRDHSYRLEIQAKAIAEEHLAALKANPRDGDMKGVRTRFGRVDVTEYEKPAITHDDAEAFAGWCERLHEAGSEA